MRSPSCCVWGTAANAMPFAWVLVRRHRASRLPGYASVVRVVNREGVEMTKYSPKASEKVEETMREMKEGKLKGGSGKKVTNPKQAVAIGLSEARHAGAKVPKKKS